MSDQELKKKYGWTRNSEQLATYSHIRLEDLENSCRKHYMLEEAQIETVMLLKPCPSCNAKNKPHEKFCANCKKPLDIKEILAAEGKRNAVDELVFEFLSILAEENPRIKGRFVELVKRKNVEGLFK